MFFYGLKTKENPLKNKPKRAKRAKGIREGTKPLLKEYRKEALKGYRRDNES
jgi:hypothetical protein